MMALPRWLTPFIGPLIALGIGSLGTGFFFWLAGRRLKAEKAEVAAKELLERIARIERSQAIVDKVVEPFWTAAQRKLVDELTHFHTPELDRLMEHVLEGTLTAPEDVDRLAAMLAERATSLDHRISPSERDAALILPAVIRKAYAESQDILNPETPAGALKIIREQAPNGDQQ